MKRREFFKKAGAGSAVLASVPALAMARPAQEENGGQAETKFQWVIGAPNGAPAKAQDGSTITFKGSGTFVVGDADEVTGGGTWSLSTGESGTYRVTGLARFDLAPGRIPNPPNPDVAAIRAGLAFLRVAYSDRSRGFLVVGCHLPGTPDSVAEGIIASKGFVLYWNHIQAGAFFRLLGNDDASAEQQ